MENFYSIAFLILNLFALYANVFVLGVCVGFKHKNKKTPTATKKLTAAEISEEKRNQKELENFLNYSGKPQDVIDG